MKIILSLASKVSNGFLQSKALQILASRRFISCRSSCLFHNHSSSVQQNTVSSEPTLKDFMKESQTTSQNQTAEEDIPYLSKNDSNGMGQKVHIEVYGCQMNNNDTEIVYSILQSSGYEIAKNVEDCDIVLLMTCSIREGAEQKIWRRVDHLKEVRKSKGKWSKQNRMKIGILGCMAERLKLKILEKESQIDLICGPDSYRSLPRLLSEASEGHAAANVLLSLDETYADIQPIRLNPGSPSAYVSIMRGCDNMCTYCVVPFTRGRERSRPLESIVDEVKRLSDQGIKDITLLGQNVNSYRDTSAPSVFNSLTSELRAGFKTVYKPKPVESGCYNFVDLLDRVSLVDPEMRVRFTSPHPKDFPTEVLELIRSRRNICRHLHVPAQSGSDRILESMGRGYTSEIYLELIQEIRSILPGVALSSDFIAGFCGETEEDHNMTLNLMEKVKFNMAYCFAYSMREKTRAFRRLEDNVEKEVKIKRTDQLVEMFRKHADLLNKSLIGSEQLVLVEGTSKRSEDDLCGRSDGNTKVIFPKNDLQYVTGSDTDVTEASPVAVGEYVVVEISAATSQVLKGVPKYKTTLKSFYGSQVDGNEKILNATGQCEALMV